MKNQQHITSETQTSKKKKSHRPLWIPILSAAACLGIAGGIAAVNLITPKFEAAAEAVYPKMAQYPNESSLMFDSDYDAWRSDRQAHLTAPEGYADGLWDFYTDSTRTFLSGSHENAAYSPLSLYMALSMLAETTSGNSRQQILDLLNAEDIEKLRTQAEQVWNSNYCNDGAITSVLADSIWLAEGGSYDQNVLDSLAQNYYASAYVGKFGSDKMNNAVRDWLNKQTDGLLSDAVKDVALDSDAVFALYSTVLFKGKWSDKFNAANNTQRTFHGADGDSEVTFMNRSGYTGTYFWGEDFGAVQQSFVSGCDMWLILPDEDKTVDDVLASGEYMQMVSGKRDNSDNSKFLTINLSLPKFDVSSTTDLNNGLNRLGVTDIFSPYSADFSTLCGKDSGVFTSSARQSARVTIDEEGCTAAAFTEMMMCGAAMPPDEKIDMTFDRPFLFVLTGIDGQPLFTGTVRQL